MVKRVKDQNEFAKYLTDLAAGKCEDDRLNNGTYIVHLDYLPGDITLEYKPDEDE